jgi:hypothetical protein
MKSFKQFIKEESPDQTRARLAYNKLTKNTKQEIDDKINMSTIQNDPLLSLGYKNVKDEKTGIPNIGQRPPSRATSYGDYDIKNRTIGIQKYHPLAPKGTLLDPEKYKSVANHELGHSGSMTISPIKKTNIIQQKLDMEGEEFRQRVLDLSTNRPDSEQYRGASRWTYEMDPAEKKYFSDKTDSLRKNAKAILSKEYNRDRQINNTTELGKAATRTIIP